jgi:uncharacterized membrane protein YjfL (UPF0719 family)
MGKWDFDGDEAFFFFVATIFAVVGTFLWNVRLVRRTPIRKPIAQRFALASTPLIALAGLGLVLMRWADPKEVVGHLDYQLLFFVGGGAWLFWTILLMPMLGIGPLDDAIERANPAAVSAVCGALLGSMAIYAYSNIGAGPTIWTTIAPALVGAVAWILLWLIVELISRPSEAIAIDRDEAAGIRHAGWLLACGLIIGRSAAGDWTSWESTWSGMWQLGWPVILLAVGAMVLNFMFRPTPMRAQVGNFSAGFVPAIVFVLLAIGYIAILGAPEIGKHIITYEQYMQGK